MGLVAPAEKPLLDASGQPVKRAADPFFLEVNNELADKGFLVTATDDLIQWARTGSLMWMTFWLACCAVEGLCRLRSALRFGALRRRPARLAAPGRRDDRRRHAHQQDGPGAPQGPRPDAGAALRHLDGLVRQRRRLLPLFVRGRAAATASCRSISTFRAVRRQPKLSSMACSCFRRRSGAPERSSGDLQGQT